MSAFTHTHKRAFGTFFTTLATVALAGAGPAATGCAPPDDGAEFRRAIPTQQTILVDVPQSSGLAQPTVSFGHRQAGAEGMLGAATE